MIKNIPLISLLSLSTGAGIGAVSDPGVGALLQRAGLRALTRNPQRHAELPRVRRKHPSGLRQVGHAGAVTQPLALLQRGERLNLLSPPPQCHQAILQWLTLSYIQFGYPAAFLTPEPGPRQCLMALNSTVVSLRSPCSPVTVTTSLCTKKEPGRLRTRNCLLWDDIRTVADNKFTVFYFPGR